MRHHWLKALVVSVVVIAAALPFFLPLFVNADSWEFPPTLEETVVDFGANKIVKVVDARENTHYPAFIVKVLGASGDVLAMYRGVSFEDFAISEDGQVFVGISNRGLPQTAFFALGAKGELLFESKHQFSHLKYCDESVTLVRRWYDQEHPDVRFSYTGRDIQWLSSITVNGCDGATVDLLKVMVGKGQ